jgi:hypothetical protein
MLTKAGDYSFIVPLSVGSIRITRTSDMPVKVDGELVDIPPEGLRVQSGQEISWTVRETTREDGGLYMHFGD